MTLSGSRDGLAIEHASTPLRLLLVADASTDTDAVMVLLADRFPRAQLQIEVEQGPAAALARLECDSFDLVMVDVARSRTGESPVVSALRSAHPGLPLTVITDAGGELGLWARIAGPQTLQRHGGDEPPFLPTAIVNALRGNQAEEGARRYLELARGLLDALDAPTCAVDRDSRIVATNLAWRDFARDNGGTDQTCGIGVSYLDVCDRADGDGRCGPATDAATVASGIREVLSGDLELFSHDYPCHSPGQSRWFSVRVTPAAINGGRGAVITHVNMTDLREIELTLAHRTMHDDVTGLPNRALLLDRLGQAISDAERRGRGIAVAHIDLSGIQRATDTLQYGGRDALLVEVADRLRGHVGPGDTVARESNAEFLVLWRCLDRTGPDDLLALGRGLLDALAPPLGASGVSVPVTACVGVAHHADGEDAAQTMRSAGLALVGAKARGPQSVVLFTEEFEAALVERTSLEMDLRLALAGTVTQLVLHYQPVVDLASREVVAVEALVRWQHPVLGLVGPERFIPIAEETGLLHDLGRWVLEQAVRDAALLTHQGRELDIAVNFSVLQLNERTASDVERVLERGGLPPGRLTVEVTETALAADEDAVAGALEALSELGITIAIDDFGTGYSSLHYLRRFPIDIIKIDREFVAGIGRHLDDEAICESIVNLAAAVGATTVGEGVETTEQHAFLQSLGCEQGQGFWWSGPVPVGQLAEAFAACAEVPAPAKPTGPRPIAASRRSR
ncbi:putative bifunctional diguanylate cyclase/phosphodiesterase [Aeromicrobium wangtongii]|uniref:putative bifunctional diguanylate cyclase/phosphodiesterase n=1 Tax=Aeromicrobium wangtongii TaxID=2969247 RepID=UPI002017DCD6|nr:EAL domain-containing protein [Aeromicrobium wangtongii]MCL3819323.1 EAL domain-containing protein [Aeromicrobium wangtongii]